MDYEQYLYGRTARDAAHRGEQAPRHGGRLIGSLVALGVVAGLAVIGRTAGADKPAFTTAPRISDVQAVPVTLTSSSGAAPSVRH